MRAIHRSWAAPALLLAAFAAVYLPSAWVSDDAMITFRSVEQVFAGAGPRWNPHERVQAFTHPLWFALLFAARVITPDLILGVTALSFVATAGALAVAGRTMPRTEVWVLGLMTFVSSRALLDFSSSGLETALLYLLLAVLFGLGSRPAGLALWLTVSAVLLCRIDLAPLVLPIAIAASVRSGTRLWHVALGLSPLALWTGFSVVYYGFPLPNTAYAKLLTGIPARELAVQGLRYLAHACRWDPITVALIAAGVVVKTPFGGALRLAIALQLAYVVWVGGDFMAGRFLAPIAWLALMCLGPALAGLSRRRKWLALMAGVLVVYNLVAPAPPLRSATSDQSAWRYPEWWGIADERGHYYARYGLLPYLRGGRQVQRRPDQAELANRIHLRYAIGYGGWTAPLDRILIDPYALADPLLARLPCSPPWRIGHFTRAIPAGYPESLESGANLIVDPTLRAFYADLLLATQGDLFTAARWSALWRLNVRPRASIAGG